jgi:YD repeat-containing protein
MAAYVVWSFVVSASGQCPICPDPPDCYPVEWLAGPVSVVNNTPYTLFNSQLFYITASGGTGNPTDVTPVILEPNQVSSTLYPGQTGIPSTPNFFTGDSEQIYGCFPGNGEYGTWLYCQATSNGVNGPIVRSTNMLPICCGTPSVSGTLYFCGTEMDIDDLSDGALNTNTTPDCGMPVWHVSDPYISLWLKDEPLGYQPARGPRISCELAFKQREFLAGWNPNIFGVGVGWNFSWLSYVTWDINSNNVVHFPGGGQRTYFTTNDYLTDTILTENTTNGFTVLYPDGRQDVYGFVVTNHNGAFLGAYMTARLNPQGQQTQLTYYEYNAIYPIIKLQYVIDGDGRTTTNYYATNNAFSTNLISQITDPFGRSVFLGYDSSGHLTNITDVGGISSSFLYDNSNWVTNLTTPYGTNSFAITDTTGTNIAPNGRSVLVTEPDGGTELYLYQDNEPGIAASYSTIPGTTPFINTLDSTNLNLRDSFHWGRMQYAALSTTNISEFTTNDFRKARMKHWLLTSLNAPGQTLSMECAPSPDSAGTIQGQITWYDYAGKTNTEYEGTQFLRLLMARVLPDGTTSFSRTDRNPIGNVLTNASTWSAGGSVAVRTNIFTYNPTNGIDLIIATNAMGVQVSSNLYNSCHETLTHYDALNQATTHVYNTNQQLYRRA